MRISRAYLDIPLHVGNEIALSKEATRHLVQVLRLQVGAPLVLFNGDGYDYTAQLMSATKSSSTALISDAHRNTCESPLRIQLTQAISRGDRMELTLQKSVELGVAEVTPVFSQRSTVKLSGERLKKKEQHWRGIITSACEQSGRAVLPPLHPAQSLRDHLNRDTGQHTKLLLSPTAEQHFYDLTIDQHCEILIGPEGGLDGSEIEMAEAVGYQPVRLGPRILRTETAALTAISILQARFGDLR